MCAYVCVCVCAHMHACMYEYVFVCVHVCVHVHSCMFMSMCVCLNAGRIVYMCVFLIITNILFYTGVLINFHFRFPIRAELLLVCIPAATCTVRRWLVRVETVATPVMVIGRLQGVTETGARQSCVNGRE